MLRNAAKYFLSPCFPCDVGITHVTGRSRASVITLSLNTWAFHLENHVYFFFGFLPVLSVYRNLMRQHQLCSIFVDDHILRSDYGLKTVRLMQEAHASATTSEILSPDLTVSAQLKILQGLRCTYHHESGSHTDPTRVVAFSQGLLPVTSQTLRSSESQSQSFPKRVWTKLATGKKRNHD